MTERDDANPTILVIDDEQDIAELVAGACSQIGANVATVSDGSMLRAVLSLASPDGIIMDVLLPGRDGIDLLRDVAELAPNTRVLMMSGYGDSWLQLSERFGVMLGGLSVTTAQKPLGLTILRGFVATCRANKPETRGLASL